jgi:simple sugar transport system permease protein
MDTVFSLPFLTMALQMAIRAGTPLLYATLGEIITERSGVLNLGIEGMMLMGALAGFAGTYYSDNLWLGFLLAILAGGVLALLHGVICITLKGNQVVSGIMLVMLGLGLTSFFGAPMLTESIHGVQPVSIPLLRDIPIVGVALFQQDVLVYIALLLVPVISFILFRTRWGLAVTAVGETPEAADSLGVSVITIRYICIIIGGILSGIAGAYISIVYTPMWRTAMTGGRGWIAVALVIFAAWKPWRAVLGAYLIGGLESLHILLQMAGVDVSPYFVTMFPYIVTIIILVFTALTKRRIDAPAALAIPYERE